jgi:uncharacterized membrane protein YgdD (TMEM256/DUF423 family)
MNRWVALGCVYAFTGVAMGAFGAHGLRERLDARAMEVYQTGAHYQLIHALALIAFGIWGAQHSESTSFPAWAFAFGIVIFSGSLYALAITDIKILGAVTPIGGLLFLAGWASFAYCAWTRA